MFTKAKNILKDRQILIVEDEFIIADDVAAGLQAEGAAVLGPVAKLQGALELLSNHEVDGAILDVNLGGEMVFPLADQLMKLAVPFVFVTGYSCGKMAERFATVPCISKPFKMRDLVDLLNRRMAG